MSNFWLAPFTSRLNCAPFAQLETYFALSQYDQWPNAKGLNELKAALLTDKEDNPEFICQLALPPSNDYYEQIIFEQRLIPTRPNSWHDLFNGLVWLQFPKSKNLLNRLHMEDIARYGLNPRTVRRNHLTHLDECGVVVAIEVEPTLPPFAELLRQHEWERVFVEHRTDWQQSVHCFMFGHANLEMLLQPFIGLTGKWLSVAVPIGFSQLSKAQQLKIVDEQLYAMINSGHFFNQQKPLHPMPLLGIPEVHEANEQAEFYANTAYFRPKPINSNTKIIVR